MRPRLSEYGVGTRQLVTHWTKRHQRIGLRSLLDDVQAQSHLAGYFIQTHINL